MVQTLRQSIYMILHHKIATLAITHHGGNRKISTFFLAVSEIMFIFAADTKKLCRDQK